MPAQWLSNSSGVQGRVTAVVQSTLHNLAQPARARRVRQIVMALLALWAVLGLARLIWALFPSGATPPTTDAAIINPVSTTVASAGGASVDIDRMMAWHLFGEASIQQPELAVEETSQQQGTTRDGIEEGARETRLDLKLRGVVASTTDGMGHAIIEHKKRQQIYAVDDKLPVAGQVVLAKVMPRQVVLDNAGKYELLVLYEEGELDAQLPASDARETSSGRASPSSSAVDMRRGAGVSAVAQGYRQRLYQNPQSLAEVVTVSAVREDGELLGYRIAPGKDLEQFELLGFKKGDIVTGVNGIALNDPANTMRLYQTMRSASEAVFELQRESQQVTVNVNLESIEADK